MTPEDLAAYRATYNPDGWQKSLTDNPSTDGRTQIIVGASLAVRALCAEVEQLRGLVDAHSTITSAPVPGAPDVATAHRIARAIVWSDIRDVYMLATRDHIHPPALYTLTDVARLIAEARDRALRAPELYPADQFCLGFGDGTDETRGAP